METRTASPFPDLEYLGAATAFFDDIIKIIDSISLLDEFNLIEIDQLTAYMECYAAPAHTPLVQEGEEGDLLLLILTGQVDVIKTAPGQDGYLVASLGPGAVLGEMSLVDGRQYEATCITREPTDFAILSRSALDVLTRRTPALGAHLLMALLSEMTGRLREPHKKLLPYVAPVSI